jgi:hypothetical protein
MIKCTIATDGRFAKLLNLCTQAEGFSDCSEKCCSITVKSRFDRVLQKRAAFEEFIKEGILRGNFAIK